MQLFIIAFTLFSSGVGWAQEEHELVRRIVVFPLQVEAQYNDVAENIWWELRKKLTNSKRFLVASKNFMESKDVFQARGALEPADTIILGRLLDAHALVTMALKDRVLRIWAYESRVGYRLWEKSIELHPSLPVSKQLPGAAEKLFLDFIASIPYQGHVIKDELVGQALYRESGYWRLKADIGAETQVAVGDPVQIISLTSQNLSPLFDTGAKTQVKADGRVVKVDRNIITVQIDRIPDTKVVKTQSLVRLPSELKRLKDTYAMGSKSVDVDATILESGRRLTEEEEERKPLITTLTWVANIAILLMIGF